MEEWKDIPGYEGRYQASSMGRIRNIGYEVKGRNPYTGREFIRKVPSRILKPGRFCKSGHVSVVLGKGTSGQPVHQLVMKAFVGEPPDGMEVLHKNGNPTDNRLENLDYGSRTENILDVYKHGKKWRKLSIEDVEEIRFGLAVGTRITELARMHGVSQSAISGIKTGKNYWWLR